MLRLDDNIDVLGYTRAEVSQGHFGTETEISGHAADNVP
jgi:hypothetical protein